MIEDVLKASVDYINEKPRHSNFPNFARGKVYLDIDNTQYSADVVVGITARGKAVFYDLVGIKKLRNGYKYHLLTVAPHSSTAVTEVTTPSTIHQSNNEVNKNKSESSDKKPQLSIDKLKQYSYEELVKKPDIKVADISTIDIKSSSRQDIRKKILRDGMADAEEYGYSDNNGNIFVMVKDSNKDVMISKDALRHGLDRRLEVLGPVEDYIAYFIVNSITLELQSVDVLYSVNAKNDQPGLSPQRSQQMLLR